LKILLPVAGVVLLVVSVLVLQNVMAGIGLGIAGLLIFGPDVIEKRGKTAGLFILKISRDITLKRESNHAIRRAILNRQTENYTGN